MAYTVLQVPPALSSAHGKQIFCAYSDNVGSANYKYVFDVYIAGVKVATSKISPNPTYGGMGIFDAGPIVRSYINSLYFVGGKSCYQGLTVEGKLWIDYTIKLGEEYGTPVTTYTNIVISASHLAYNTAPDLYPVNTDDLGLSSYINKFTSRMPREVRLSLTDYAFTGILNPASDPQTIVIRTYDGSGTLIDTVTIGPASHYYAQFGYGPANINAIYPGTIDDTVSYYTVYYTCGSSTDLITVALDCFKLYKGYALTFLNRLGAYDTWQFKFKSSRSATIERKAYGTNGMNPYFFLGDGDAFGGVVPYSLDQYASNGGRVFLGAGRTYSVKSKQRFKLTTDFLTDEAFEYLAELVTSPVIYMQFIDPIGLLIYLPVRINTENYNYLTRANDKLNPLEVEVEILDTYNSQFQ
jgi:hypothetical protein